MQADAKRQSARTVAHEAIRVTHGVSVHPRSVSPGVSGVVAGLHDGGHHHHHYISMPSRGHHQQRSGSRERRAADHDVMSTHSHVSMEEDEAVFDAQVEHIRNLLSIAPQQQQEVTTESATQSQEQQQQQPGQRKQALELELRLLTVEMNTLAQRAFRIREELNDLI
jgi:hypothetical protein